jgi:hypothetical protein
MSFRRESGAGSTRRHSAGFRLRAECRSASAEALGASATWSPRINGCEIAHILPEGAPARAIRRRNPMFLSGRSICSLALLLGAFVAALASATPASPPQLKTQGTAGLGFELDASEADVLEVVKIVAEDPIVRGTYVYENSKTLTGARPADSSAYFGTWTGPGHAFYKVLSGAVAPRHFKDSGDSGTITVRYVVLPQSESRTHLRIDAVFVEDGHRKADFSDGTVESSEFKEIQDRLRQIQFADQETAALLKKRQEEDEKQATLLRQRQEETAKLEAAESSLKSLDSRFRDLRHKVVVKVKNASTELKSAPFHSAEKTQSLTAGAELVVLIVTPSWFGVETTDNHRGWLQKDQVEALP